MTTLLTKWQVIAINKRTNERHGGSFVPPNNLLKEGSLDYLIETVSAEIYGQIMYPTISDKAAFYFFQINSNHIFQDGNKRTGIASAQAFLRLNGMRVKKVVRQIELKDGRKIPSVFHEDPHYLFEQLIMDLASGIMNLEDCSIWFKENVEPFN